ncbi:MAG: hydroxyacid dehydrogenase [Alphaproteobacteria bacterium]|nr:MAG: hydroxyacid dehydrogenase [Alphaproteobacteria bacterium]
MENRSEIILYQTEDGRTHIQTLLQDGTVWLSQAQMAELYDKTIPTINEHIKNIYEEGELSTGATIRNFLIVQTEGKRQVSREVAFYNLDMVLAIGYRVRSHRGTQFRQWATTALKEYLVKGFVMNDERLKNPAGADYFDELLERIRDIRASEKLFYQKVKDIYSNSLDYDPQSDQAQVFFKTVQNKMLYAVTGMTAAELVARRADGGRPNMGLTTWQGAQKGKALRKSDVITAKNYLAEKEIADLNRIVTMFLDTAEDTAQRRQVMRMKDWEQRLDEFLRFNERDVLKTAGKVSHDAAEQIAHQHYEAFDLKRRESETIAAERAAAKELTDLAKQIEAKKPAKKKDGT